MIRIRTNFFNRLGIYRNLKEGWITGVSAGIAERTRVKPLWIRIGFVMMTLLLHVIFLATIILYLLLAFLMKTRDSVAAETGLAGVQMAYRDLAETITAPPGSPGGQMTGLKARFAALDLRLNDLEAAVMSDELSLRRKFKDIGG